MNSLKKRTAPAPPPPSVNSTIYGTLPHAPRHSQSYEVNEMRTINHKNQSDMYSTLPHVRNVESSSSSRGGSSFHCDNKAYERFDPIIISNQHQQQQGKYDKQHSESDRGGGGILQMTTFGHKRSPSGESLNRNIHLAGAKLVLPTTGEIPSLKPVDKTLPRPRLPPPGPPSGKIYSLFLFSHLFI